ncbi:hypothetical protein FDH01_gp285 [Acinetobacter phage vB_AbaM_ME3]|uniref:Uncharacterized protein n=1 Tax=Acinetobacter phage vB_AbaM_ME3 TaxID=1837876 RepID=A0A172Q0G7_9CAUD|nr:hypothetical protein FDH01_gp285 [Acinetobacter phage vB_AbaM_ME3]AND75337.1 hypothetical protein ME3_176 [Acinetobacter phage vB_AbaM_ME3]
MAINRSEIIRVSIFLKFFNISLEQYFNLSTVPFPVITEYGRVIYRRDSEYFCYDMTDSRPNDTDRSRMSETDIRDLCFIDLALFDPVKSFSHRYSRSNTDRASLTIKDDIISVQTAKSSRDLDFKKDTGIMLKVFRAQSEAYPFTSLDLVNDVSDLYDKITNPIEYKGVYDPIHNLIHVEPINSSNPSKENTLMSSIVSTTLDKNKEALITATKLEVGNIALDLVTKQLVKALPEPMQVLVGQSPLVKIAVANLANVVVSQLSVSDPRITAINDAMLTVAFAETIRTFNFQEIIESALSGIPKGSLDLITGAQSSTS